MLSDNPSAWTLFVSYSLSLALPAFLLMAVGMLFSWRYRTAVAHYMSERQADSSAALDPSDLGAGSDAPNIRQSLVLRETHRKERLTLLAGDKLSQARQASRRVRCIYGIAGSIQTVCTASAVYWIVYGQPGLSLVYPPLLTAYLTMLPSVVLLATFVMRDTRSRAALLAAYLVAGVGVIVLGPDHILANSQRVVASHWEISLRNSLLPLVGTGLLISRRLRPFALALAALVSFLLVQTFLAAVFFEHVVANLSLQGITLFAVGLGVANFCLGAAFLFWLLRRRHRFRAVALFVAVVLAALAIEHWLVPTLPVGQIAAGAGSNVLQFYILLLVFQGAVRLQEQRVIPSEILHLHICWLFVALCSSQSITVYFLDIGLSFDNGDESTVIPQLSRAFSIGFLLGLVPFAANVTFLHAALRREWIARRHMRGGRLLLLRVFGDAGKRARLFDMLGESWRRIGRIDYIAGTDLAQRHVGARALEAFVLGRLRTIFLKSPAEVDQRIASMRDRLEGDIRYPVNELYCFADAWQHAVRRLAPDSDVVIMDLRGFTSKNRGCAFELGVLLQTVVLERILLLTDATTSKTALAETIQAAWLAAPAGGPNVSTRNPELRLVPLTGNTKRDRENLEAWVFSFAFDSKHESFVRPTDLQIRKVRRTASP